MVPPSLPPHPGVSQLRPLSSVPFHSWPDSYVHLQSDSVPALQSCNPFRTSPLPVPVLPCNPLPTNPFLCMVLPPGSSDLASLATSSMDISDFDIMSPVPPEGHVPPFPNPFAGVAPAMTGLVQDQLLQALNMHFYNTNIILDHLQVHAATTTAATTTSMAKKYIALPDGFDGHPKNWHIFEGQ